MLTVKRSEVESLLSRAVAPKERDGVVSGYHILDDKIPEAETPEEQRERRSRVLERLLNYENYSVEDENKAREQRIDQLIEDVQGVKEDDLTPSSTTMQFEGQETNHPFKAQAESENVAYRMSTKGKIMVAVYSFVVAVVLALIVLNSGVISAIQSGIEAKSAKLSALQGEYAQLTQEIDRVSSEDYVIERAQELGLTNGK